MPSGEERLDVDIISSYEQDAAREGVNLASSALLGTHNLHKDQGVGRRGYTARESRTFASASWDGYIPAYSRNGKTG